MKQTFKKRGTPVTVFFHNDLKKTFLYVLKPFQRNKLKDQKLKDQTFEDQNA